MAAHRRAHHVRLVERMACVLVQLLLVLVLEVGARVVEIRIVLAVGAARSTVLMPESEFQKGCLGRRFKRQL